MINYFVFGKKNKWEVGQRGLGVRNLDQHNKKRMEGLL